MAKIVWTDLPKTYGLFTRRSAIMVTLDTKKMVQQYSLNTKINVVQYTNFNGSLYFRTMTAKEKGLNWAIKADYFTLPTELASLVPSPSISPSINGSKRLSSPATRTTGKPKQKSSTKKVAKPKSEEAVATKKPSLFSKLLKKLRRK